MDDALVRRIARGERLGAVALSAVSTIAVGAAMYGAAFGVWRSPLQALFAAIKLPALFLALVLVTAAINAMLAILLRAPLGVKQSAVCILAGLAATAVVLGALSPASACIALAVRGPAAAVFGLPITDPRAASANAYAQALLLSHVAVIAVAGVIGNLRLYRLLRELSGKRELALRVLFAWLGVELLGGSELSWIARPFLGRPHTPVVFVVDDPLEGSFFEEVGGAMAATLGAQGTIALALVVLAMVIAWRALTRSDGLPVDVELAAHGLVATSADARWTIAWSELRSVAVRDAVVLFADAHELVLDVTAGPARRLLVRFDRLDEAEALRARIDAARQRTIGPGPFRSSRAAT